MPLSHQGHFYFTQVQIPINQFKTPIFVKIFGCEI